MIEFTLAKIIPHKIKKMNLEKSEEIKDIILQISSKLKRTNFFPNPQQLLKMLNPNSSTIEDSENFIWTVCNLASTYSEIVNLLQKLYSKNFKNSPKSIVYNNRVSKVFSI